MKQTIQLIIALLLTFLMPMLTSWLLSWQWISEEWPRYTLTVLLMVLEFALGLLMIRRLVNQFKK